MTKVLEKGDVLYWARIIPETGIFDVNELKLRTVEEDYFVGTDNRTQQAFLFSYSALDNIVFSDRNLAISQVKEAELLKKKTFDEIEYEEY